MGDLPSDLTLRRVSPPIDLSTLGTPPQQPQETGSSAKPPSPTSPNPLSSSSKSLHFPHRQSNQHPGRCKHRTKLLLHEREQDEHKDLPPWVYKPLFPIYFPIMLSGPFNVLLFIVALCLYKFSPLVLFFPTTIYLMYRMRTHYNARVDALITRGDGLSHIWPQRESIKTSSQFYQDSYWLKLLYCTSPYRLNLWFHGKQHGIISKPDYDGFYNDWNISNNNLIKLNQDIFALKYPNFSFKNSNSGNIDSKTLTTTTDPTKNDPTKLPTELLSKLTSLYSTLSHCDRYNPTIDHTCDNAIMFDNLIYHQPIEGYCFYGTIATLILSLPNHIRLFATPKVPSPVRLDQVPGKLKNICKIIVDNVEHNSEHCNSDLVKQDKNNHKNNPNNTDIQTQQLTISPFSKLELYHVDNKTITYSDFLHILLRSNSLTTRIALNFLRTPLFNPQPKTKSAKGFSTVAGHWSPIGGVVFNHLDGEFYALVLDVNHSYGSWICTVKDLFDSCYSRDECGFRGLAVFTVEEELFKVYQE